MYDVCTCQLKTDDWNIANIQQYWSLIRYCTWRSLWKQTMTEKSGWRLYPTTTPCHNVVLLHVIYTNLQISRDASSAHTCKQPQRASKLASLSISKMLIWNFILASIGDVDSVLVVANGWCCFMWRAVTTLKQCQGKICEDRRVQTPNSIILTLILHFSKWVFHSSVDTKVAHC